MNILNKSGRDRMILKNNTILYAALLLCLPSVISANITTMQYWDPVPFFNAANLNMPADTPFCYGVKQRICDEDADTKHRRWGINISPFVQRAIRAQQTDDLYFGVSKNILPNQYGREMSDFQGTAYLMGLFLGQDENGNSIWGGPIAQDTGVTTDITATNIADTFYLMPNLQNSVSALNNITGGVAGTNAIIYNTQTNPPANTAPSILSQSMLEQDRIYFGAFSVPLTYQKAGFRWELNFDISDSVGFLARGGFCQITQRAGTQKSLSALAPTTQPDSGLPSLYSGLNIVSNIASGSSTLAQNVFDEWVDNNIDGLLDATNGADYDISTFSDTGIEDIQLLAFIRHPFPIHPEDPDKYLSMLVTPYAIIGWTLPIAGVRDYSKLYALPFGNNGHTSVGGVLGLTFDFIDSIEFGFEFGATGFLKKTINELPCPNHQLQRVLYPYRQNVEYHPGFNSQFAAIFNAYEFAQNTSFSFRYNYVQHNDDTITLITPSQYFFPNMLEDLSGWTSQTFIAALTFEIQPAVFLSMAWQGALSQKNAYCSNTILGSLNFAF